ncbi:MAG TPA: hypothetical protein EYQ72_02670, partial [Gammaproteobacteria bacterium]|nr:hypothetical protein [Gammaproteobacteria bacterium]
ANDFRVHFGLADNTSIELIEVQWPSGKISEFNNQEINQTLTLKE